MGNVKIYKCLPHIYALALTVSEIYFQFFLSKKIGKSHGVQFSQLDHSMENVKICKCLPHIPALALTVSEIYKCFIFTSKKSSSRSRRAILAITSFDDKCQHLQTSYFTFFIFAKVWPLRTIVTDTHTDSHAHTETENKPMVIDDILQICLKNDFSWEKGRLSVLSHSATASCLCSLSVYVSCPMRQRYVCAR